MNWMNLSKEYSNDSSYFVIIPIKYEYNASYGKGMKKGPEEIIVASKQLEYYDEQFNSEPFIKGIKISDDLDLNNEVPDVMVEKVKNKVIKFKHNFVMGLGGDHSVSIGLVKGMEELHDDFSVIVLDAHSDFRYSWNDSKLNHACVSKQISKKHSMALVGVRSMDVDEHEEINNNENIHLIKAYDFNMEDFEKILNKLNKKIYLSIDVDVFDSSFIRNTGTPEPGGFNWNQVIEILKLIFNKKEVIGCDVVEFSPKINFEAEAYAIAKLVYKIMALKKKYV